MSRFFEFRSRSTAAALGLAACAMLVPANMLPVLDTRTPGQDHLNTIISGVAELWTQGLWGIASIVFVASILIPFFKLAGLAVLLHASIRKSPQARALSRTYALIDLVGRWSMLDVFLAVFLTGLIRFGSVAGVEARPGIVFFAAAVVLTVLATRAFDPRLLWQDEPSAAKT